VSKYHLRFPKPMKSTLVNVTGGPLG
jgi:hypothetical protein